MVPRMLALGLCVGLLIACGSRYGLQDQNNNNENNNNTPACGNGIIEAAEECDGSALAGESCQGLGWDDGELACGVSCTFDTSACTGAGPECGNGVKEYGEACDHSDLGGETCQDLGFDSGTLACSPACQFDATGCTGPGCGNAVIDAGEACDSTELGGQTCQGLGHLAGTLACGPTCQFDESLCVDQLCGNDTAEGTEDCDGIDLQSQDCTDHGFTDGTLGCAASCTWDTSGCFTEHCGNGVAEPQHGEACDGADLNGQTCLTQGWSSGTLVCTGACQLDDSSCVSQCGNGLVEPDEACDDGNFAPGDGCSASCQVEPGWYCAGSPSLCQTQCGDGIQAGTEDCDQSDLGGEICQSLGFDGGTLACTVNCSFNTSQCFTIGPMARQIWEWFPIISSSDIWDLEYTTIGFTPTTIVPNGYTWSVTQNVFFFPITPGTGIISQPITFASADDSVYVDFFGYTITFFGATYSGVYVNSHGNATFNGGDTSYQASETNLTGGLPRIAANWTRLNVLGGGTVTMDFFNDRGVMTFDAVQDWGSNQTHSFQVEFFMDGRIHITNLEHAGFDGLVGISEGGGTTGAPEVNFVP